VAILFGVSNRPTLFICYPGSIEKLTLLGAIYYYYYYSRAENCASGTENCESREKNGSY
jgi:hypothetical protein